MSYINPISKMVNVNVSGSYISVFSIPRNKIGKLAFIEVNKPPKKATVDLYDSYEDTVTEVSGFVFRKRVVAASGVDTSVELKKSVKLLQDVKLLSDISGFYCGVMVDLG